MLTCLILLAFFICRFLASIPSFSTFSILGLTNSASNK